MEQFGRTKPQPDFIIRLVESDIRPWKVPMRALARTLQAVQRLVDQREEEDDPTIDDAEIQPVTNEEHAAKALRLVDVTSSSAAYAVAAPAHDTALDIITNTGKGIAAPARFNWNAPTLSAVRELSEIARSLHCAIEIRLPNSSKQLGDVLAEIRSDTFDKIVPSVFIRGDTTIYAKIERVGGATEMHCGIRLPSQPRKMVICKVAGAELVRDLGRYMYQHVLLSGRATWFRRSRNLKYFKVVSFEPPKAGSIREAFEDIYNAGGKAWDDVDDPDAKIAEIRGT